MQNLISVFSHIAAADYIAKYEDDLVIKPVFIKYRITGHSGIQLYFSSKKTTTLGSLLTTMTKEYETQIFLQ